MKKLQIISFCLSVLALASCSKSHDKAVISVPQIQIGQAISNSGTLAKGSYKGTMLANQTYTVGGDITINAGDTLLIQKGVKLNMAAGANIIVNGDLIMLGTQSAPITVTDPLRVKTTGPSTVGQDSAYNGGWGGIYCSSSSKLVVLKWTHFDFGGAALKALPFTTTAGLKAGAQYIFYFENPNGAFILEDSWIYGTPDDVARFYGGHVNIMRNTMEKFGNTGGDGFNPKGSTVGNMAYNMLIGGATNGTKTASDGTSAGECQFAIYNNTYVNDGFRNTGVFGARSGSVEVENNSRALVYNNLIADCDFGVRIAGGPGGAKVYLADTTYNASDLITQTAYGYNFNYVDNAAMAGQIVPTSVAQAVVTHPEASDIPNMVSFFQSLNITYTFGLVYDGSSLVGKNNPMFVNYPLPAAAGFWITQASIDGYNFHLQQGSPAAGKGTTSAFTPITQGIPVDPNFGSSGITAPGQDMGCYQLNGGGNQH
ncbi:hypothetical protein HDF24_14345 [Mucilaginibacter sp. X4EP1]|uniref:hypothetical protein n=1 Tax=Mucilaginibacter sp. X4EP1 TaxID=2723092 RepID=UPI0021672E4B|nr:hypothetical protein [Mucilaginibacter sp. X4EP1]MCS3814747.1 hypothetical protein [Mucilaginibacter sp. X4EP1]